jgi:hypothetical protein
MTPGEVFRMYRMYHIRQSKEWERVRFLAWYSSLPYRSKGDNSSPYEIMELETDPDEQEKKSYYEKEQEEALQLIREYKERGLI